MQPLSLTDRQVSRSNQFRVAFDFYANFHFSSKLATAEGSGEDLEAGTEYEYPCFDGCSDIESVDRNEVAEGLILRDKGGIYEQSMKLYEETFAPVNHHNLPPWTKFLLLILVFPISNYYAVKQIRTYLVIAMFNYTGINLRTTLLLNIETERDWMMKEEAFKNKPITLDKVFYLAERYMTYSLVIALLISVGPFINQTNIFQIIDGYTFIEDNSNLNFAFQVLVSGVIAFANLIPSRAPRPDISSFLSSFTGDDYSIRDSCHTRLKDLSEILADIKKHGFVLLNTDIGSPIIVSIKVPEELATMLGFTALLNTNTFDNNQILRFIQIEEDVDTFFVLRNDIGMCHRAEHDPFHFDYMLHHLLTEQRLGLHLEVSSQDLQLYGGATVMLLVGLFVSTERVQVAAALLAWVLWPIGAAILFRRRKSLIASINFFTLDGKDRKYQPFNNICVCSDDVIVTQIHSLSCFCALAKFTLQENYLIHILLKVAEDIQYDWLHCGLTVQDFKRLASLAVITYEKDVGIITPHARTYYSAPRRQNEICVVCVINLKGEVASALMTRAQFTKATRNLPDGEDTKRVERMLLR